MVPALAEGTVGDIHGLDVCGLWGRASGLDDGLSAGMEDDGGLFAWDGSHSGRVDWVGSYGELLSWGCDGLLAWSCDRGLGRWDSSGGKASKREDGESDGGELHFF